MTGSECVHRLRSLQAKHPELFPALWLESSTSESAITTPPKGATNVAATRSGATGGQMLGRYPTLAAEGLFAEAAAMAVPMLDANPPNHFVWFQTACLLARGDDMKKYRDHCQSMLERFKDTTDRPTADRVAKASLFVPNSGADLALASQLADRAVLGGDHQWMCYFQLCKGLAEYRCGRYQSAADWLAKSVSVTRKSWPYAFVEGAACLAMSQFRLGHAEEARSLLAEADRVFSTLRKPGENGFEANFHDWIISDALRHEAAALINGPATRPATRNSKGEESP